MILRKTNAVLSLLTTFMLIDHAMFHAGWMLSRGSIPKNADNMPWILVGLMMAHAILSIVLAILGHKGAQKVECKNYSRLNITTKIQRISGVSLILLTALHIAGTAGPLQPPQVIHAILPPLFFAVALAHVAISASKALITLGIGSARFVKIADIVIKALCAVTLVADIAGFYLYLV